LRTRYLGLVMAIMLLLLSLSTAASGAGGPLPGRNSVKYVALGDSIAAGVGATDLYGYTLHFRDYLATTVHGSDKIAMEAYPGDDTADLLTKLRTDQDLRQSLKRATVVTISIGGNDLLPCIRPGLTEIDPACVMRGLAAFGHDWPLILQEIRGEIGSDARLEVMTIYNPVPQVHPAFALIEMALAPVNAGLADPQLMAAYSYQVADAHAAFLGLTPEGFPQACVLTHACDPIPDIHPTDAGHALLAQLHADLYGGN
jgi:lysophospholipase L1-like esterase